MDVKRSTGLLRMLQSLALAVVGIVAASNIAHAQYGFVFGTVRPGPGDQQMVRDRVQELLDGPADPRTLEWQNSRTGNSGSVSLMREFTRRAQQCRQIEYRILPRAAADPQVAIILWCKQANGRWGIVS
jgi:surface antigen